MFVVSVRSILMLMIAVASVSGRQAAAQETDPLVTALSARHAVPDRAQLSQLAGGEDALVARLLVLRQSDELPVVAVRAEKILLEYADRADVQSALIEDISDPRTKGLARAIASGVDKVPSAQVRAKLAEGVSIRSNIDPEFAGYKSALAQSPNSEVREAVSK